MFAFKHFIIENAIRKSLFSSLFYEVCEFFELRSCHVRLKYLSTYLIRICDRKINLVL